MASKKLTLKEALGALEAKKEEIEAKTGKLPSITEKSPPAKPDVIDRCESLLEHIGDETPSLGNMQVELLLEILRELRAHRGFLQASMVPTHQSGGLVKKPTFAAPTVSFQYQAVPEGKSYQAPSAYTEQEYNVSNYDVSNDEMEVEDAEDVFDSEMMEKDAK